MIDFFTSTAYYVDHLAPVWAALPPSERGVWLMPADAVDHARSLGVTGEVPLPYELMRGKHSGIGYVAQVASSLLRRDCPVAVASYGDLRTVRRPGRRIAFFEHGAGMSYGGDSRQATNVSFAGGRDRDGVELFLVPGKYPAERNRAAHPDIPVVEIGCPKLDRWHGAPGPDNAKPVVAFAWHWDNDAIPEARSAFSHFERALRPLMRDDRFTLLAHQHPRASEIGRTYEAMRIRRAKSLDEIFAKADVLVADSTSALYEFAALDRPVVVVNAPWYRRDMSHGLRFWDAIPGIECDEPDDLADAIAEALEDKAATKRKRRTAVKAAYTYNDGTSAERAAGALMDWLA